MRNELEQEVPLGRIGTVNDIASLVALLVSPRGSYITGTVIPVDGGLVPRRPLREEVMTYVNMMPAELAAKYTREKLWMQKTVFDILAEQAAERIRTALPSGISTAPSAMARSRTGSNAPRNSIAPSASSAATSSPSSFPTGSNLPSRSLRSSCSGAIANKVNPDFRARELGYMLKFSGSSAYVFPKRMEGFRLRRHGARPATGKSDLKQLIVVGGAARGHA